MPKELDFEGSGFKGAVFEQKGFQERNLESLLIALGSKEAEKTVTELAKIKKDQWREMGTAVDQLKGFIELGGTDEIFTNLKTHITTSISTQVEVALEPLTNLINELINTALEPFIDKLTTIVNDLTAFIGEGAEGALIGGVVGGVASLFLPGGPILIAIGAVVGSAIQQIFGTDPMNQWRNEINQLFYDLSKDFTGFLGTMDKMWQGFLRDWEAFWTDPLGGLIDLIGIDPGLQKTFDDIGGAIAAMWSGFWSDTGLF